MEKLIVKMQFGSHLYGTNTLDSDVDYKGIFMPSKKQIFLGRIPKSYNQTTKKNNDRKNTSGDTDTEIYSLHYFIELACQGQTVALDMLHAPQGMILISSPVWDSIIEQREKFYTKNLKAFIGYARRQAAKYGIKGSRLNAAGLVLNYLKSLSEDERLSSFWNKLPQGEHIHFIDKDKNGLRQYQIVGKIFQETSRVGYVIPILQHFHDEYGKRAQLAAENKGIDWKAISHALRAAYQTKQLLTENIIVFPLKEASYLLKVKQGQQDYITEVVPILEDLMDEIEKLSEQSGLPAKVNRKYWDRWLEQIVGDNLF